MFCMFVILIDCSKLPSTEVVSNLHSYQEFTCQFPKTLTTVFPLVFILLKFTGKNVIS